jgi:LytS/YehU family sensor histidine kinase
MQIKFQTLKDQLNPHFLFNSLNVLSSLTSKDPEKAQKFVDEFSMIYRYTLDVIDKPVVELKDEIEFVKSFLYLQKIRFDDAVEYEINIDAQKLTYLVPPLALQTLLENSFKHNKASSDFPLMIKIFNDADFIVIVNNLQPKTGIGYSTKVGLENLRKRYDLICGIQPSFTITENEYIAKIPLINPEQ